MKKYEVTITEYLKRTVTVEAENQVEAEVLVEEKWNNSEYILDADDFDHTEFRAKETKSS